MINAKRRRGIMGDIDHEPLAEPPSEPKPGGRLVGKGRLSRRRAGIGVEAFQDSLDVIWRLKRRRITEAIKDTVEFTLRGDGASCKDHDKDGPKCHGNVQRPLSSCRRVKRSSFRSWL